MTDIDVLLSENRKFEPDPAFKLTANVSSPEIYASARSGKIMRRLLRDIAEGRALGDTTTLADPNVVASLRDQYEDKEG